MLKVNWKEKICIHSGDCVKNLPEVFKVEDGEFVIDPSAASDGAITKVVTECPSKALSIEGG